MDTIDKLLNKIADINDSYEDIMWLKLKELTDEEASHMTVKEFLQKIEEEYKLNDSILEI